MLAACHDASIRLYDLQMPTETTNTGAVHTPIGTIRRSSRHGHQFSVSCVDWYPVDSGIFISGAFDGRVKVWDANRLEMAWDWDIGSRVNSVAMSPVASHGLIAVGSSDSTIRLCDLASGGATQSLCGHKGPVLRTAWAITHPFYLYSGSRDGQLRLWDVRGSGCLHVFHRDDTQTGASLVSRDPSQDVSHQGAITDIVQTPDGRYLISSGTDDQLHLWDAVRWRRVVVYYHNAFNRSLRARQMSISDGRPLLFFPSGSVVQVYNVESGEIMNVMRGHVATINCSWYTPHYGELYTGAGERRIGVWAMEDAPQELDMDQWSEEE